MPRSYTRKYAERPSPPYPANEYCGRVKRGNDGAMWLSSKVGSQSACTWKPVVRSPRRSREAHNMLGIRSRSPSRPRSPRYTSWPKSPKRSLRSPKRSLRSPKRSLRSPKRSLRSPKRSLRSPKRSPKSPRYTRSDYRDFLTSFYNSRRR
jgi:hypothetical protein